MADPVVVTLLWHGLKPLVKVEFPNLKEVCDWNSGDKIISQNVIDIGGRTNALCYGWCF